MKAACEALQVSRATVYRHRQPTPPPAERPTSHRALAEDEVQEVLAVLNSERFADKAPAEVYATLLDEERYLCSISTMYRILRRNAAVRERRNQLRHPDYAKPELLATGPNQLWSWDITKLKGPRPGSHFHLYVILDVFSRYVVGWMVAANESTTLAKHLIAESVGKQELDPEQLEILTLHADRGTSMRSNGVAQLLAGLGVTKTHSRPQVSNDNPYSESQFKTLKYRPGFPARFGCLEDARAFCRDFFRWYNHEHRHHGIALLTPKTVHYGHVEEVLATRQAALNTAFNANPERFGKAPRVAAPRSSVWINPPSESQTNETTPAESQTNETSEIHA